MEKEKVNKIFEDIDSNWNGDNAYQGLQIIAKYIDPMKTHIITGAGHDVMGSVSVTELLELGITEEDIKKLALLNWSIEDDALQCFT